MGQLIIHAQITVNGAFEAPSPDWMVMDPDSSQASLDQVELAEALVLGRKTYEGLAAVWPTLADDPAMGRFAKRINAMPKYVASRTLREPLEWNATLLEGDIADSVKALKERSSAHFLVSQVGEFADALVSAGLVDEFWFWVNPTLWPSGPRIFDGVGPVKLDLVAATPFQSGVVWLRYRPSAD